MGADAISTLPPLFFKPKTIGKVLCLLPNFNKRLCEHYESARILEVARRKYNEYKSDNNQRFKKKQKNKKKKKKTKKKKTTIFTYSMYSSSKSVFVQESTFISDPHA